MKLSLLFVGLWLFLSNCSQPEVDKIITGEIYYPEENVTLTYEMNQDSILHGNASWTDSTNRVYLEEVYDKGKVILQIFKEYHENGQISSEVEFLKKKEVSRREYLPDGSLKFECPLDITKVGKLQYTIDDGKRDYLLRNQENPIKFFADNLPSGNQMIATYGAIFYITEKGWVIKPSSTQNKIRVHLECRTNCKIPHNRVLLDSITIRVK